MNKVTFFKAILAIFFIFTMSVVLLLCAEIFLKTRNKSQNVSIIKYPWQKYIAKYSPFSVQHLHPYYYFFLPTDQEVISSINNNVVSITENGFRGDRPKDRKTGKLAFIIGGSSAFGYGSTSNSTTISGWLNTKQSKYYFVNAGVPSWNSTQEFYRISLQLVEYSPELIIIYDGHNDCRNGYVRGDMGVPATPESYEYFEHWFSDIRKVRTYYINWEQLICSFIPELYSLYNPKRRLHRLHTGIKLSNEGTTRDPNFSSEGYSRNLWLIKKLCNSFGIKTLFIWQANAYEHKKLHKDTLIRLDMEEELIDYFYEFKKLSINKCQKYGIDLKDYGSIFDEAYDVIPDAEVFIDRAHTTDLGNSIISDRIIKDLKINDDQTEK